MTNQRPLPEEIYVRRRVAALVILLLVVVLVIWGLTAWAKSGDAPETENATVTQTAESAPVTEPTVPEPSESTTSSSSSTSSSTSSSATATSSGTATSASPTSSVVAKGSCELKDLQITAATAQASFPASSEPKFYMEVRNPTDTDCVIDLNSETMRYEVYDMASNKRVWADTDCYPAVETGTKTFPAGETLTFDATWSGTASQPGQCSNRQSVAAGAYYLHGVIGNNASDAAPFNIT